MCVCAKSFEEHNAEVVYAAEVLITKIVRLFSDKLNFRYGPEVQRTFQIRQIILQLHRQGYTRTCTRMTHIMLSSFSLTSSALVQAQRAVSWTCAPLRF
jgi:hypothetical protein